MLTYQCGIIPCRYLHGVLQRLLEGQEYPERKDHPGKQQSKDADLDQSAWGCGVRADFMDYSCNDQNHRCNDDRVVAENFPPFDSGVHVRISSSSSVICVLVEERRWSEEGSIGLTLREELQGHREVTEIDRYC
jgi:hypothetical protein